MSTMLGFHMTDDFFSTVDDAIAIYGADAPDAILMTPEYEAWLMEWRNFDNDTTFGADIYSPDYYGEMMTNMLRMDVPDMGDEPSYMGSRRAALQGPAAHWFDMKDRTNMQHHRWNGRSNK